MSLSLGTRLGPYQITAKLGEGGMGEVYRATDTKLKRDVAIKVLPQAFTEDKQRLARFEREAQLLAQLHHPNVASMASRSGSRLLRQAHDDRNAAHLPPGDPRRIRQPARRPNH
jgi:serine/threonine protein kinase